MRKLVRSKTVGRYNGLICAALTLLSAAPTDEREPEPPERRTPMTDHVVLIVIDGVRHSEIFEGTDTERSSAPHRSAKELMPKLWALAEEGTAVRNIEASGPNFVSLPGYSEIVTGLSPRCRDNACERPTDYTLVDLVCPTDSSCDAAIFSSWPVLARLDTGLSDCIVSAGTTEGKNLDRLRADPTMAHILERGQNVNVGLGGEGYRSDASTSALALEYLKERRPPFMFVSVGDTDEYAHAGHYENYVISLERVDAFIGKVHQVMREIESEGSRATIFVTTDHGRSKGFRDHGGEHPESRGVWLVAAGSGIAPHTHINGTNGPARLRDIAQTIAFLMGYDGVSARKSSSGRVLTELLQESTQ